MEFGTLSIAARPLSEAQPLAYRVLALVQVQCVDEDADCNWTGDYGKFLSHATLHADRGSDHKLLKPETTNNLDKREETIPTDTSDESVPEDGNKDVDNSNGPVTSFPRWKKPNSDSNAQSTNGRRDTPPSQISRKKSETPVSVIHSPAAVESKNDDPFADESASPLDEEEDDDEFSFDMNGQTSFFVGKLANDFGTSINSMAFCGESGVVNFVETTDSERGPEGELETIFDDILEGEQNLSDTKSEGFTVDLVDKAHKLKKQANAKFNKGDFAGARKLYTEAIRIMDSFRPQTVEEKALMSHVHSNRAVTFFREKKFETCIEDCEKAIEYDPSYDKNWIRMWRALMALGDIEKAHLLIIKATEAVPGSNRIREEYHRSLSERELLEKTQKYFLDGKHQIAKELIEVSAKSTTNLKILCLAARIEISLGQANGAMEQANKALRVNSQYPESLEIYGHALMLMGDTEKATQALFESHKMSNSKHTKKMLTKCQKINASLSQARTFTKRGRHSEALDQFNSALAACEDLPRISPLLITLRCERAESYLWNRRFSDALQDCQDVLELNKTHVQTWIVYSEVLAASGREKEALRELNQIRKDWGAGNILIDDQYRKIDYEHRISQVDDDLIHFVKELENGVCELLVTPDLDTTHTSERRSARKSNKSSSGRKKHEMSPRSPHHERSHASPAIHSPEEGSLSPKRRIRVKKRSDRNDEVTVITSRGKQRPSSDDMSRTSKLRPRRRADDGESVRAKSRPRKSDEASVITERRPRSSPRKHNDSVSVVSERRKSSSRRHRDDDLVVAEKRRSPRRLGDTMSVVSSRKRSTKRESAESTRKERIEEAVKTLKTLGTKSR
jgi:tetratricopeptide (TPR) repeat protein